MAQYIDKDALLAEIERLDTLYHTSKSFDGELFIEGLLSFLDTHEVKEVNLEEKARQLSQKYFPDEENIWARSNIEARKCKSACLEMVEWLKAQKGE